MRLSTRICVHVLNDDDVCVPLLSAMVLQRYLTRLVLAYARRYIRNIEANLSLSLWGGDVVLNNLDLRLDGQHIAYAWGCHFRCTWTAQAVVLLAC